jgi:uncharacterized membrane protein YhaH (DUF805 family)
VFCTHVTQAIPLLFAGSFFVVFGVLFSLFLLLEIFLFALSSLSFLVRRFHDMNCSGGWTVAFLFLGLCIPFLYLILVVLPGTKGENRFGPEIGSDQIIENI